MRAIRLNWTTEPLLLSITSGRRQTISLYRPRIDSTAQRT